ncbi:AraC family transcriptional regulator [Vibrio sp. Evd11]|uniref:helix-turn-helix domain-containing protein n=1 Tax=Vibrio sp. Evd11 TaxID=1207404 RepID=UPI000EFDAA30|nr:AraC family transcriptional regulator [Vibrio sp. Evd11]
MQNNNYEIPLVRTDCVHHFGDVFKGRDITTHSLIDTVKAPFDIQTCKLEYLPETILLNLVQLLGESVSAELFVANVQRVCKESYIPSILSELKLSGNVTLQSALEAFCEILTGYSSGARISLVFHSGHYWLVRRKNGTSQKWFKYAEIFSIIFMDELVSALSEANSDEKYATVISSDLESFFKCSLLSHIQFFTLRSVTALRLDSATLSQKVSIQERNTTAELDGLSPIPRDFVCSLKHALKPYLSTGKLSISRASDILDISTRTIQRRLTKAGVTYSDVLEELVLTEITDLLKSSRMPITTIATRFGYGDSANFTRLFKRKMKMTPSRYRRTYSLQEPALISSVE